MHFIKLIRPLNLIIIAITMYGIGWYFEGVYGRHHEFNIYSISFHLLVFSTIMIAAAGNIINDYFDVRADRINKPDRLIIGKYVKRRYAIVSHWGINLIAFCIAIYLSWVLETFWYLFIHLLAINILWYYSMYVKRKFLIGNILIAALTALVPILVGFYFHQLFITEPAAMEFSAYYPFESYPYTDYTIRLSLGLAGFAFILNFAREIVKDMEDVEGDKKLRAKTLPIVLGYAKTKWVAIFVLFGSLISTVTILLLFREVPLYNLAPIGLSAILVIACFFLLLKANNKSDYRTINHLIKLAMVAGLIIPIYWKLLMIYG